MVAFRTADAIERLASRQTNKQLGVPVANATNIKTKIKNPNLLQSAVRGLGVMYDYAKNTPGAQVSTPVNTGSGVSMGGQQNAVQNIVEPVRVAGRRAVGDITAIPGVGQPSASPTAADIRSGNYVNPIVDYATLLSAASTASPRVRQPVSPTSRLVAGFADDQTQNVLRSLSNDIQEYVADIGRINPNLRRQYTQNKELFRNITPENLTRIRRLDPDFDNFISDYLEASKDYLRQSGLLGWP